ncbi:MAG: DUF2309 domain-containing protein [Xanthomonadales bacterium PRO7]|nr:DUF2309 domain-containing protein [Xanthomonadales bacterium PRO7]
MNAFTAAQAAIAPSFDADIDAACKTIAPSWPLDRQIAVNPYWGFIDQPFAQAAASLGHRVGTPFALDSDEYLRAWRSGEIDESSLMRATAEHEIPATADDAVDALKSPRRRLSGLSLLSDWIDQQSTMAAGPKWRDVITQQVSQYCASYFDDLQADWHRDRRTGLFVGWRNGLRADHAIEPLMHVDEIRSRAGSVPDTADAAMRWSLARLGVPRAEAADFMQLCLWRINGWASWCAGLEWEARLAGKHDAHLRELLAIRVCWEALLHDGGAAAESAGGLWHEAWSQARRNNTVTSGAWDRVWQRAHEIAYQDRLIHLLDTAGAGPDRQALPPRPAAQVTFCIDVRSERFRRALEHVDDEIETLGFAGFFGLPIRFTSIGTRLPRPLLPGLLAPSIEAIESTGSASGDAALVRQRSGNLSARSAWQPFLRTPSGAFSLVETIGLGYAASILRRHFGAETSPLRWFGLDAKRAGGLRPRLCMEGNDAVARKADLVAGILRAMSLTRRFARLLVFVGHGSQSANNPQAAALDCGACGGQTGEINARILAELINDTSVRKALADRGIEVPDDTVAVGALHNTTTDEVRLFDVERVPESHRRELQHLQRRFEDAGHRTRAERAPSLGLDANCSRPERLLKRIRRRASDWAQTRPEWGLAGNAALIVAPRSRTRGLALDGRSFLHDYAWAHDRDGKVLELIMTAPMVVAHWINMQYYASTVDPERLGSGNKVLHNVVCGRIGVFEGNTGDLRIGLARQSVHDGSRWMHAPLRLSVFIDAPAGMIERVLEAHSTVRNLVVNQWLYLFRFADRGIEWFRRGRWQAWAPGNSCA